MNTPAPPLKRRLASMLYESMLLFGVLFIAGWLFSTALQQRHALYLRHAQQIWLLFVLAMYFVWFWTHGGQTLAMKTWRMRLVTADGQAVPAWRALVRYLLSWMWFLPGLAVAWVLQAHTWMLVLIPVANMLLWTLTIFLNPQRQFLHDVLAGTRLVVCEQAVKPAHAGKAPPQ